jgi:hypothetical protein
MQIRFILIGLAGLAVVIHSASAQMIVDDAGTARNGDVGISYYREDDSNNKPPSTFTLRFAWPTGSS